MTRIEARLVWWLTGGDMSRREGWTLRRENRAWKTVPVSRSEDDAATRRALSEHVSRNYGQSRTHQAACILTEITT